jgi:hypothetical protein
LPDFRSSPVVRLSSNIPKPTLSSTEAIAVF